MKKHIALIAAAALGFLAVPALTQEIKEPAAMAKAMAGATVKLDQGIKASAAQGTPISAKYELDDKGALHFKVPMPTRSGASRSMRAPSSETIAE